MCVRMRSKICNTHIHTFFLSTERKKRKPKVKDSLKYADLIPITRRLSTHQFSWNRTQLVIKREYKIFKSLSIDENDNELTTWAAFRARFLRSNIFDIFLRDSMIRRDKGQAHSEFFAFAWSNLKKRVWLMYTWKIYFRIKNFSCWQCDAVDTTRPIYCV